MVVDDELLTLQRLIAQRLAPLGSVTLGVVCRTVCKVLVTHKAGGVGVRVLVCRESEQGRPFVNVMPLVDGKVVIDDSQTLRGVLPTGLDPVITTIEAAFEIATKAAHL